MELDINYILRDTYVSLENIYTQNVNIFVFQKLISILETTFLELVNRNANDCFKIILYPESL